MAELHACAHEVPAWGRQGGRARQDERNTCHDVYRSTRLYNIAMSYNRERGYNLDRDRDGIACEKR
jgi:hypothetical protein